jgi:hypothetical protein
MKKNYMKPISEADTYFEEPLMTASGDGMPFAGTDHGENDPSARQQNSLWSDEDDN